MALIDEIFGAEPSGVTPPDSLGPALLLLLLERLMGRRPGMDEREQQEHELRVRPRVEPLGGA